MRYLLAIAVMLLPFVAADGQDARLEIPVAPVEFTLADLEGIAFENNPTLAAAASRIEAAQGRYRQVGLYPNPVIGYHATEVGNFGTSGAQGGFVSQRLITGGKLRLNRAVAGHEVDAAHFRFHVQERRVLSDVRLHYYDALVAQQQVQLTADLATIGDNLVKATKTLLLGRVGTENDLLQAEIRADQAYILQDNAQNELAASWRQLAAVIGSPTMQMPRLTGQLDANLPEYDWNTSYSMVINNSPELHVAQAEAERAACAVERARREPIPNVDISVSVRDHDLSGDQVANLQVGIPIPFFDRNQGNIHRAEAEWVVALQEVERVQLSLQNRLAVSYRTYANARQQVERYRQRMVPKSKRSLDLVTAGYEKGEVRYLTLLTAQQTYVQVNLSYLKALQQLRAASTLIEGQLLSGSLKP